MDLFQTLEIRELGYGRVHTFPTERAQRSVISYLAVIAQTSCRQGRKIGLAWASRCFCNSR